MTPKEMLAKLSTQLSKSQNEYMSLDVAIELTQNIALLTKLEPYHLPEITKLICGSHSLMDLFSDEYKLVCPFYHDNSIDTMMMHFREKDKDSAYYIDHVFPLADDQIIDSFIFGFNRLDKTIRYYSESIKDQKERQGTIQTKIDDNLKETSDIDAAISQYPGDSTDETFKGLSKKKSSLKGNLTKYKKEMDAVIQKISDLKEKYDDSCEQYRRVIAAFNEAKAIKETYSANLSQSREKAYEACDDRALIKTHIHTILDTGSIPRELAEELKRFDFCVQFLSLLSNSFPDRAVSILALLYENGIIDICEEPFCHYLETNADAVAGYFLNRYLPKGAAEFTTEVSDFDSWCDFIVSQSFFNGSSINYTSFDALWDRIPSAKCWRILVDSIAHHDGERVVDCIAKLLLRVSGNPRRNLLTVVYELIQEERIDGCSAMVVALIDNHRQGDDCSAIVELLMQKSEGDYRKLKGSFDRLKFNADRLSAKVYGSLSKPIEDLEILASNISSSKNAVSQEIVSSKLKKGLVALRDGLEEFDVFALEDANSWVERKAIPFNPEKHSINISTPPQKVYLRTLGFTYRDVAGELKSVPAIVGRLQELDTQSEAPHHDKKAKSHYRKTVSYSHKRKDNKNH